MSILTQKCRINVRNYCSSMRKQFSKIKRLKVQHNTPLISYHRNTQVSQWIFFKIQVARVILSKGVPAWNAVHRRQRNHKIPFNSSLPLGHRDHSEIVSFSQANFSCTISDALWLIELRKKQKLKPWAGFRWYLISNVEKSRICRYPVAIWTDCNNNLRTTISLTCSLALVLVYRVMLNRLPLAQWNSQCFRHDKFNSMKKLQVNCPPSLSLRLKIFLFPSDVSSVNLSWMFLFSNEKIFR